jgi:hypothetical protein
MVHVLVRDDDQPKVLDAVAQLAQRLLELVEGLAAVGAARPRSGSS